MRLNLVMIVLVWVVYHGAEIFAPDASISKTIMATRVMTHFFSLFQALTVLVKKWVQAPY